jgi:ubiquinone biosynthesis protein
MVLSKLKLHYAFVKRYKEIVQILVKYGFAEIIKTLELYHLLPFKKRIMKTSVGKIAGLSLEVRLRMAIEELGPTAIKFGQFLSTRPDILPKNFLKEFSKLQDDAPRFAFKEVKNQIEKELGKPINKLFKSFNKKAIAAASIGQVHEAITLNGKEVIVKIQRPEIEQQIMIDLEILMDLAQLIEKHYSKAIFYKPTALVKEFSKTIKRELDYHREARNAERFAANFKESKIVKFPRVYWSLSGKKVLTLEKIKGKKLSELDLSKKNKAFRKKIVDNGAEIFFKMILIDGFFHADPHPGNIFILDNASIALMDFGMVGFVDREMQEKMIALFEAIIKRNPDKTVEKLLEIIEVSKETNLTEFKRDVAELLTQYYNIELQSVQLTELFNEVILFANKHKVLIPSRFMLLIKTLLNLEGICRTIYPQFNLVEASKPFIRKLMLQRLQPSYLMARLSEHLSEIHELITLFPNRVNNILKKIETGEIEIAFEHRGLEKLIKELDRTSNRLGLSMIISAIFIGSSLIILSGRGPSIQGLSVFGLAGYLFSGFLGLILIYSIFKSGKI